MKKKYLLFKVTIVFTFVAFQAFFLTQPVCACTGTVTNNPEQNVSCQCSGGGLSSSPGSCGGPAITGYGAYFTCSDGFYDGLTDCTNDAAFLYYSSTPCAASYSYLGLATCALALIADAGATVAGLGVCFTAGVWTGGTACYGAITADIAIYGTTLVACYYCNIYSCAPSSTGSNDNWVTPSHPVGSQCES
jgi:hypothetical protein